MQSKRSQQTVEYKEWPVFVWDTFVTLGSGLKNEGGRRNIFSSTNSHKRPKNFSPKEFVLRGAYRLVAEIISLRNHFRESSDCLLLFVCFVFSKENS